MKIYTEINYKWLDGQLVKIDSKSFEYDGEVSLCMPGVTAGIASGVSGIGTAATGLGNAITGNVQQGAEGIVETAADVGTGVVETAVEGAESLAETTVDVGEAALEGVHEGVDMGTEALHSVTDTGKDLLHSVTDTGKDLLHAGADALTDGRDTLTGLFVEDPLNQVMEEVGGMVGGGAPGTESFAKGNKGKKQKNNPFLAIEKGKKSARGSTKIRRPSSTLKINK